jgi:hypothetical protein
LGVDHITFQKIFGISFALLIEIGIILLALMSFRSEEPYEPTTPKKQIKLPTIFQKRVNKKDKKVRGESKPLLVRKLL